MTAERSEHFFGVLGMSIKLLRVERGWSQEELGIRAGLDRTYIGAIERGERNVGICNVVQLAGAMGLSLSELVTRAEGLRRRQAA
ncbi:MAG: helix-turn-helix transcriptional regulator [Myxococcota bacterium]|nr:helix-turn-helix transcriptional regulator [Myxococcota bacterium]